MCSSHTLLLLLYKQSHEADGHSHDCTSAIEQLLTHIDPQSRQLLLQVLAMLHLPKHHCTFVRETDMTD